MGCASSSSTRITESHHQVATYQQRQQANELISQYQRTNTEFRTWHDAHKTSRPTESDESQGVKYHDEPQPSATETHQQAKIEELEADKLRVQQEKQQAEADLQKTKQEKEQEEEKRREAERMNDAIIRKQEDVDAWKLKRDIQHQRIHGERDKYLLAVSYNVDPPVPSHWHFPDGLTNLTMYSHFERTAGRNTTSKWELDRASALFREVGNLMQGTWRAQLVGKGKDAKDIKGNQIAVNHIEVLQNPSMLERYYHNRAQMVQKYLDIKQFNSFERAVSARSVRRGGAPGDKYGTQVLTTQLAGCTLQDMLIPEVNEVFLFHGTPSENAEAICNQGPDFRLSGTGMLGRGLYFADSSTKSDQYTDKKGIRKKGDKTMFVSRVLLGDMFMTKKGAAYARPPCAKCRKSVCKRHGDNLFDSVVYIPGEKRLFREFVLYEKDVSYCDFLVTYERF